MPVSEAFARILALDRAQFNARVADAKRRVPGFDSEAFAAFLQSGVDGVVAAVSAIAPDRAATTTLAAYDLALTLSAQGMVGPHARTPMIGRLWAEVFPALAQRIVEAPAEVMGALSNAMVYLASHTGMRAQEWLHQILALGPRTVTVPHLLNLGKVLAWRSGAAHFRGGALLAADELPGDIALAAVGAPLGSSWEQVRARFAANPWWTPEQQVDTAKEIGEFIGFGGAFSRPPEIRVGDSGFWVRSGDRYSLLVADAWGAVLLPATAEEFASPAPAVTAMPPIRKGNRLIFAHRHVDLDFPAEGLSLACNEHSVAVTSLYSHTIKLFALQ